MSSQITTSFVEMYSSNVGLLAQQMSSKLRSSVDVESVKGKNAYFEQLSATACAIPYAALVDSDVRIFPFWIMTTATYPLAAFF